MNYTNVIDHIAYICKLKNKKDDLISFLKIASENCLDLTTLDRIAFIQNDIKDYYNCIESLKICLKLATANKNEEELFAVRANLAKIYNHVNEPGLSLAHSKLNSNFKFDFDTIMESSFSYYLMGNYKKSEEIMRELILNENLPEGVRGRVEYNLGSYDIENGDFKKGLKGFIDVGHKIKIWITDYLPSIPIWTGEDISGKTIFVHGEGGIGDEIITVRFVKNLQRLGANPIWLTKHEDLYEVFNRNNIRTLYENKNIELTNAVQCSAMYLPVLLNLEKNQLWDGPYLKPSENYIKKWKEILPLGKKLAVKWSGNPYYDQDLHRSIPVEHIKKINYNGTFINLQLEPELYQSEMFNAGAQIKNIEDTLAIIYLCDDLLTSCTSVAHMAGAMCKKATVCPPIASYYVWLGETGRSNWYDSSLRVIRQTKHKDWNFVEYLF